MPTPSRAYTFARAQRDQLRQRYVTLRRCFRNDTRRPRLRALVDALLRGRAAVSMTLATCEMVLRSGRVLTAADVVASEVGSRSGPAFDHALELRLKKFYMARVHLESLLHFDGKAKYAALYVGGEGPDYGACCVLFERGGVRTDSTCFAGDTLTTVFDAEGNPAGLSSAEVLMRFATRQDVHRLGSLAYRDILDDGHPATPLDLQRLQDLLCVRDTLLEVHVHDDLLVEDIQRIIIARKVGRSMAQKLLRYDDASVAERQQMQFDDVRAYLAIHELADKRKIPVVGGTC